MSIANLTYIHSQLYIPKDRYTTATVSEYKSHYCYYLLFSLAVQPIAGYGHLVYEIS
jgi:hypothetical protein